MKVAGAFVFAVMLSGCRPGLSQAEQRMCTVAQALSGAITVVRQAVSEDESGNTDRAIALATQGRAEADAASAFLEALDSEARRSAAWNPLTDTYLQTAQAANSMLPAFSATHGLARTQLATAILRLSQADASLPDACVIAPQATIEIPELTP